jgi:hypothetical protein
MAQEKQEFTVAALYEDNDNRFCDSAFADNVTDALIAILKKTRADNNDPEDELAICGVFAGGHDVKDLTVRDSNERPKRTALPGAEKKPYTVVTNRGSYHVMAADAADAELDLPNIELHEVASIFEGHLADISDQVDWTRYEAETAIPEEEAA